MLAEVSISDLEGHSQTLLADRVQLVHTGLNWVINVTNKKGGMSCPLDQVEALRIGGVPIEFRHLPLPCGDHHHPKESS